jgi:hypothetical protein
VVLQGAYLNNLEPQFPKWNQAPLSNAQHDQFDKSDTDQQHRKRHGIVFEPMPIIRKRHVYPYSKGGAIWQCLIQGENNKAM